MVKLGDEEVEMSAVKKNVRSSTFLSRGHVACGKSKRRVDLSIQIDTRTSRT